MKTTATTFIATATALATSFLLVAADCGMSNFQIKTSATQNEQGTEKTDDTEHNVDKVVVESTISRRDLRQRGSKSSKDPHECDIETVQWALMCAEYTFKTLNTDKTLNIDGNEVLEAADWILYLERNSLGEVDRERRLSIIFTVRVLKM